MKFCTDVQLLRQTVSAFSSVFTRDSIYAIARINHANSACPSVTRVYCIKTAESVIEVFYHLIMVPSL